MSDKNKTRSIATIEQNEKTNRNFREGKPVEKKVNNKQLYKILRIAFSVVFLICAVLFINEVFIKPWHSNKVIKEVQSLYPANRIDDVNTPLSNSSGSGGDISNISPGSITSNDTDQGASNTESGRASQGRLRKFNGLLKLNPEVKGWLSIPETNIYYPVLQSGTDDPEYYLKHNIYKESDKQGSLFIDVHSSIEENSQNIVIYGHNMTSTGNMFHELAEYKNLDFYKERPTITFDTIYQTGKWKIFAVIRTSGSSKYDKFFDYTKSEFIDPSDFLNFVYQLRVRSLYNFNVDINENDQLLTMSTCSYELENFRTVVIARRIRNGENPEVDVESTTKNNPLYPENWYKTYGGTAPKATTFEEALSAGELTWYTPSDK